MYTLSFFFAKQFIIFSATLKIQLEHQLREVQIRIENEKRALEEENRVLKMRNNSLEEQVKTL